jgi:hypothetical protein
MAGRKTSNEVNSVHCRSSTFDAFNTQNGCNILHNTAVMLLAGHIHWGCAAPVSHCGCPAGPNRIDSGIILILCCKKRGRGSTLTTDTVLCFPLTMLQATL